MRKAKHLAADERAKNHKKKKIALLVIIILLIAAVAAEVFIIRRMSTVDMLFMRSVERGVTEGWKTDNGDLQLKEQGMVTETGFIEKELEYTAEYRDKAFKDSELKELAHSYIDDLKRCSGAAKNHDPVTESEAFWGEFAEPYTERLVQLRRLFVENEYMGRSWDQYPDQLDEILFRGWIAEKIPELSFEVTDAGNGINKYTAKLYNDSGYDIDYINVDVEIYDSKDKLIGVAEVYQEDIKNGRSGELNFYYANKGKISYRVSGVDSTFDPGDQAENNSSERSN